MYPTTVIPVNKPVINQPSEVKVSAVDSGLFQYSLNKLEPLTNSSPGSFLQPETRPKDYNIEQCMKTIGEVKHQ